MLAVAKSFDAPSKTGSLWPYIPALAVIALFVWLVPWSFVQMAQIHKGQMTEIGSLPGYELLDADRHFYPTEWGGTARLRPLEGQGVADLRSDLHDLGYQGNSVGGLTMQRPRNDSFDADLASVRESEDDLVVDVSVFDTDVVLAWPLIALPAMAFTALLAAFGFAIHRRSASRI